jgi:drug/metabolite transporter (DMT)-like permease
MTSPAARAATPSRLVGAGALALTACAWGAQWPLVGWTLREVDPVSLRALMVLPGGVLMLLIARARGEPMRVGGVDLGWLVLFALLNVTAFQLCATFGVQLMNVGRAIILAYTMPLWAALIGRVWLKERLSPRRGFALLLGAGALLLLLGQDLSGMRDAPLGAVLTLGGAAIFAAATILMKRHPVPVGPLTNGGLQLLIGGVPLVLLALVLRQTDPADYSTLTWGMIAWMAVVGMGIGYTAWFIAVAAFSPVVNGIGALAAPVIGVTGGALLLGETLGWRELAALVLVCVAVTLVLLPERERSS